MSYSHVIACGCSYMDCYTAEYGHVELAEYLGATPVRLVRPGSSNEWVANNLMDALQGVDKALVLWGLTFHTRFDLPYHDANLQPIWASVNNGNMTGHEGITFKPDHLMSECSKYTEYFRLRYMKSLVFRKVLRDLIYVSGYLKSRGHDYLIWNQADPCYRENCQSDWTEYQIIQHDPGFYKLFEFTMNEYLIENGVETEEPLADMSPVIMHPNPGAKLNSVINSFVKQRLGI